MKIEQLKMEHIGCYAAKTFKFSGLSVVYGENRSGKSTMIYALYYALFGKHLNTTLTAPDLCQKGENVGAVTLRFNMKDGVFQLWRSTTGAGAVSELSRDGVTWNPLEVESADSLKSMGIIPADVASLTSFFREGELIYFLKDIPRYNKTLLQQILEMDDIFILQTRFKKAGAHAREKRKDILAGVPSREMSRSDLEHMQKEAEALEKQLRETEAELKLLSSGSGEFTDPRLAMVLQRSYDEKKNELDAIEKAMAELPPLQELFQKKSSVEKSLSEGNAVYPNPDELQRQIGRTEQLLQDVRSELQRLSDLEKQPVCHTCGQSLSREHLARLVAERRTQGESLESNRKHLASELMAVQSTIMEQKTCKTALSAIQRQIAELQHWEQKRDTLKGQLARTGEDLERAQKTGGDSENMEHYQQVQVLQNRQSDLQKRLLLLRVEIEQVSGQLKENEKRREKIRLADHHILLCDIAYQAIDRAVTALNQELMEKIRKSLREWAGYFQYLDQFDVEITPKELSPIIQAKGYTYKLNQMSKSERIFLYLMLKLAIGDALGNLGVFVLDDPADGLDIKRQEVLAHLLQEISHKRQVVVTTNDERFADMLPRQFRIDL
jgi:DNA repair exonuclease SbcCD ATPase subunit